MLLKKIYLALYHFRLTIIFLVIGGFVVVYFQVDNFWAFLLAVFLTWLQPFIDKIGEIGRQLELEHQAKKESAPRRVEPSSQLDSLPESSQSRSKKLPLNWRNVFTRTRKPFIILVSILILLLAVTYIYLYIYF